MWDETQIEEEINYNGMVLVFATPEVQRNKEIVMKAVKQNGLAIQYAEELQDDNDVVQAAVKQYGFALAYASPRLSNFLPIVTMAVKKMVWHYNMQVNDYKGIVKSSWRQ